MLGILHDEEGPNEKGPGRVKGTSGVTVRGGREHHMGRSSTLTNTTGEEKLRGSYAENMSRSQGPHYSL